MRLDLSRNNFTGSLPPAWHFHKLVSVNMNSNNLQVLRACQLTRTLAFSLTSFAAFGYIAVDN